MNRLAALITGVVFAMSVAGTALADSSSCQAYNTCSTTTTTTVPAQTTSSTVTSTLPFTGLDVGLLLIGGAGLLGGGFVVRKLSRRMN